MRVALRCSLRGLCVSAPLRFELPAESPAHATHGGSFPRENRIGARRLLVASSLADQAFWTGAVGSVWNAGLGNWNTSLTGGTTVLVLPTITTEVFFSTTKPFALNLADTLGADTTINSLNFLHGSGAVTIGAGNTLTLNSGLTIAGGSAARTINAPVLLGNAQTWTNDGAFGVTTLTLGGTLDRLAASGQLTIGGQGNTTLNGAIGSNLTGGIIKTGTGTLTLGSASNAFSGGLAINGGMVSIASDGALGNTANGVILAGAARCGSAARPHSPPRGSSPSMAAPPIRAASASAAS